MSSTAIATRQNPGAIGAVMAPAYTPDQVELIKRTVARGASNDELALFLATCRRLGLDPFARQIYSVRRWNSETRQEENVTQTGIDGLRVVAERTGRYMPGPPSEFRYDREGNLLSARATVLRWSELDQRWHEVSAEVFLHEQIQLKKDGTPTRFWARMPRVMLGKVAEAAALRRGFPQDLSGVYAHEEMAPVDDEEERPKPQPQAAPPAPAQAARRKPSAAPPPAAASPAPAKAAAPPAASPAETEDAIDAQVEEDEAAIENLGRASAPSTREEPAANSPADIGWPGPTEPLAATAAAAGAERFGDVGDAPATDAGGEDKRRAIEVVVAKMWDVVERRAVLGPTEAQKQLTALAAGIAPLVEKGEVTKQERAWAAEEYRDGLADIQGKPRPERKKAGQ